MKLRVFPYSVPIVPGSIFFERFVDTAAIRDNLKRTSVRGFAYVVSSSGAEFVFRLASTAILARLITPEHFGLFMMASAITAIVDPFRDLGLSTATIQRDRITHDEVSSLFWINVAAGVLLAILMCACAPLVASYFQDRRLTSIAMALAATFVLGGLSVQHEALLARQMRLGPKAGMRLLGFLVSSAAAIFLAVLGYGYWALVWREVLRSGFIVLGAWTLCPWIPDRPRLETNVWSHLKFGSGLSASYILGNAISTLDRFILGRFQSPDVVGLYRQSSQLITVPISQFMGPLYTVSLPGLSLLQQDARRYQAFYSRILSIVAIASLPMSAFLAIYATEVTGMVLGHQWLDAAPYIRIFAVGASLQTVAGTISLLLVSVGQAGELLKLLAAAGVVKAALMFLGLRWGGIGVAIGEVATTLLMLLPYLHFTLKHAPVSMRSVLEALGRPFASTLCASGALFILRTVAPLPSGLVSLSAGFAVTVTVFTLTWVALPGGRSELHSLWSTACAGLSKSGN